MTYEEKQRLEDLRSRGTLNRVEVEEYYQLRRQYDSEMVTDTPSATEVTETAPSEPEIVVEEQPIAEVKESPEESLLGSVMKKLKKE